ncbi:heptaprenyl diphosphate synthase component 1 [Filobacillus milosensis]|uniref:heptaprenyl diphosphate synthase component 1 n=1 Tax=Filobacillus milosensis TaxID=94137 RepID=UPI001890DC54|nr:heptaprenyl diphosphate synthase component 1 [Filobacillus milosensis]
MINLENTEDIRHKFITKYKHSHISASLYDEVLSNKQISWFKRLLIEAETPSANQIFNALLHMQTSLDIHDLVDLKTNENMAEDRSQTNQLQVLVGDFHSSYFYRLLSQQNLLEELYHFIEKIKEINDLKMSVLHNYEGHDMEIQLKHIEKIHIGLIEAIISLYNLPEKEVKSKIIDELVYQSDSCWIKILTDRDHLLSHRMISLRKQHWSLTK